ncbi:MAG TPA: LacI family transcriptional regulator [Caldithrix sp.]|nr:LacI family transcriptional regulator [Caldithrix sp.]
MPKRVTAKEVAKALGISTMTVSRALNNRPNVDPKTRQKVLETAQKLGYFPNYIAKSLVLRKTNTIGVVVPEITHSFFPEVVRGIEEISYQSGYDLILSHSAESGIREKSAIETLVSKQVDGLLISTAQTVSDYTIYQQVMRRGIPIVFYDRCVKNIGANCVSIDDEESATLITEHLIQHGYQRIGHISGPSQVLIGQARKQGFIKALQKSNLTVDADLIIEAGFHEKDGYSAMQTLLQLPPGKMPRAVVAVNDPAAFGAMKAIYEHNLRIPEDVAIVGFSDDIRAELMRTPLTTIRQNAYEVGRRAVQKLIDQIENKTSSVEEIIVKGELVIRNSCGCTG